MRLPNRLRDRPGICVLLALIAAVIVATAVAYAAPAAVSAGTTSCQFVWSICRWSVSSMQVHWLSAPSTVAQCNRLEHKLRCTIAPWLQFGVQLRPQLSYSTTESLLGRMLGAMAWKHIPGLLHSMSSTAIATAAGNDSCSNNPGPEKSVLTSASSTLCTLVLTSATCASTFPSCPAGNSAISEQACQNIIMAVMASACWAQCYALLASSKVLHVALCAPLWLYCKSSGEEGCWGLGVCVTKSHICSHTVQLRFNSGPLLLALPEFSMCAHAGRTWLTRALSTALITGVLADTNTGRYTGVALLFPAVTSVFCGLHAASDMFV